MLVLLNLKESDMIIYAEPSESIYHAAARVRTRLATSCYSYATLVFNEVSIEVSMYSYPDDIATIYNLKMEIERLKKSI